MKWNIISEIPRAVETLLSNRLKQISSTINIIIFIVTEDVFNINMYGWGQLRKLENLLKAQSLIRVNFSDGISKALNLWVW